MRTAEQWQDIYEADKAWTVEAVALAVQQETKAACRAAVEKQLIHGALSLQGKTAMEQADAVLAAIDAVEVG